MLVARIIVIAIYALVFCAVLFLLNRLSNKYTWKKEGVTLPKDARSDERFSDPKFNDITKIYANEKDAQIAIDNLIRTKSSLFK
jgi:hypothetical protein